MWWSLKNHYYMFFFYLFKGDEIMDKDIMDRLKELLGGEETTDGLTIVLEGTPIINIYIGSEE